MGAAGMRPLARQCPEWLRVDIERLVHHQREGARGQHVQHEMEILAVLTAWFVAHTRALEEGPPDDRLEHTVVEARHACDAVREVMVEAERIGLVSNRQDRTDGTAD